MTTTESLIHPGITLFLAFVLFQIINHQFFSYFQCTVLLPLVERILTDTASNLLTHLFLSLWATQGFIYSILTQLNGGLRGLFLFFSRKAFALCHIGFVCCHAELMTPPTLPLQYLVQGILELEMALEGILSWAFQSESSVISVPAGLLSHRNVYVCVCLNYVLFV